MYKIFILYNVHLVRYIHHSSYSAVGENNTGKMCNNYGTFQILVLTIYCYSDIELFSIAPCKVITLDLLCCFS